MLSSIHSITRQYEYLLLPFSRKEGTFFVCRRKQLSSSLRNTATNNRGLLAQGKYVWQQKTTGEAWHSPPLWFEIRHGLFSVINKALEEFLLINARHFFKIIRAFTKVLGNREAGKYSRDDEAFECYGAALQRLTATRGSEKFVQLIFKYRWVQSTWHLFKKFKCHRKSKRQNGDIERVRIIVWSLSSSRRVMAVYTPISKLGTFRIWQVL